MLSYSFAEVKMAAGLQTGVVVLEIGLGLETGLNTIF